MKIQIMYMHSYAAQLSVIDHLRHLLVKCIRQCSSIRFCVHMTCMIAGEMKARSFYLPIFLCGGY